jgi:hypothetical protein
MNEAMQNVLAELHKQVEAFVNIIREGEEEYVALIDLWAEEIFQARVHCREFTKKVHGETFQDYHLKKILMTPPLGQ